jgi:hypothetical protein
MRRQSQCISNHLVNELDVDSQHLPEPLLFEECPKLT